MIIKFKEKYPKIDECCFIAENSTIIGDVEIGEKASIWFGAVLRGDCNRIIVGKGSNVQDNCVVHTNPDQSPVIIGEYTTIGHSVVLHGCVIGNNTLVGMGSTILDDTVIGDNVIIGAGSLVTSRKTIPSGVLCMGNPAKVIRELTPEEIISIKESAEHYIEYSEEFK